MREWGALHGGAFTHTSGSYAWIAGEAEATTHIRRYLTTDLPLAKDHVAFLGYWKLGGPLVN